ncbi:MAG TPA: 4Fe-4S dicluster domain-containing protein [Candidatus Limnocylindria bacterium]|nr:4Fe-4S dicluster domain-containing protein [Candidatus Limnocylindria bacterium]
MTAGTKGMFVDTSVCTGCKACQVACKQWNELPMEDNEAVANHTAFLGDSYDNTGHLSATNWRHVKFVEQIGPADSSDRASPRWLMMSDSCKHCEQAGCLEVCPTGALFRTQFGSVDIHQDVCIGCRYCVGACPFGVIEVNKKTGRVNKCILCQDRMEIGMGTACAKACPTASITFGNVDDLKVMAAERVKALHARGETSAYIYGWDLGNSGEITAGPNKGAKVKDMEVVGGLNVFYLLLDKPDVYALPAAPSVPQKNMAPSAGVALISAAVLGVTGLAAFRRRRMAEAEVRP